MAWRSWVTDRHADLLQVGEIVDLLVEMPRDDVAVGVGADDVDLLDDPEVGAVDGQRAGQVVADDHVARHVPPLVERAPQLALLVRAQGCSVGSVSSPSTSISCQGSR